MLQHFSIAPQTFRKLLEFVYGFFCNIIVEVQYQFSVFFNVLKIISFKLLLIYLLISDNFSRTPVARTNNGFIL